MQVSEKNRKIGGGERTTQASPNPSPPPSTHTHTHTHLNLLLVYKGLKSKVEIYLTIAKEFYTTQNLLQPESGESGFVLQIFQTTVFWKLKFFEAAVFWKWNIYITKLNIWKAFSTYVLNNPVKYIKTTRNLFKIS